MRKVGAPGDPELALGAVAEGGAVALDRARAERLGVPDSELTALVAAKRVEVEERATRLRRRAPPLEVTTDDEVTALLELAARSERRAS